MFYDLGIGGTVYTLGIPALSTAIVIQLFTICPPVIAFSQLTPSLDVTEASPTILFSQTVPRLSGQSASPSAGFSESVPIIQAGGG